MREADRKAAYRTESRCVYNRIKRSRDKELRENRTEIWRRLCRKEGQNGRQTEVRHIFQGERRGRTDAGFHGILKKDRGEREKAVGSQKASRFVSRRQRQSS